MSASHLPASTSEKHPSALPDWLSNPDPHLPLNPERVKKLKDHLNGRDPDAPDAKETSENDAGAAGTTLPSKNQHSTAQSQTLYGHVSRYGHISWKKKPMYPDKPQDKLIDHDAAYVVRKTSNGPDCPWEMHSIIVQSPRIMDILRSALSDYPGVSPAVDNLTLSSPFKPMLHRWANFQQAIDSADQFTKQHIEGFAKIIEEELSPYFQVLRDADNHNIIEHDHLWTVFRPGELVWGDIKDHHTVGQVLETKIHPQTGGFIVIYEQMAWNGFELKAQSNKHEIPPFTGTRLITELNAIPLERRQDADRVKRVVLDRGRKLLTLLGCHYREYLGFGLTKPEIHPEQESMGMPFLVPEQHWEAVSGRVVLDAALWNGKFKERKDPPGVIASSKSNRDILIYSPLIKGYALSVKKWYELFIEDVSEIIWDNSFSSLVLGQTEKDLLLGFAQTKLTRTTHFDDMVRGKGKGVIILLSGPPGVGKTLTVESIASIMRAPLYAMSAGELGSQPAKVELQLRKALTYCKEWNAVLLLDEADVFLQERSASDLERNELVSIFLRLLEYYDGMMFLTTNRISSMDPAFQSRIDLTIHYSHLSESSRAKVWRNFMEKDASTDAGINFEDLASHVLNGRQIKNVVKLAKMLAVRRDEPLHMSHLNQILQLSTQNQISNNQ